MDYEDLLDGLIPDLSRDDLPTPPDLPEEFVLVEDGDPNAEAAFALKQARRFSEVVYGTAYVAVEDRTPEDTLKVHVLDPSTVRLEAGEDEEVEFYVGDERVEGTVVTGNDAPDDYYGTSPGGVLEGVQLESVSLVPEEDVEGFPGGVVRPVEDEGDHGEQ